MGSDRRILRRRGFGAPAGRHGLLAVMAGLDPAIYAVMAQESLVAYPSGRDDELVNVAPLVDAAARRFADPDLDRDGAAG